MRGVILHHTHVLIVANVKILKNRERDIKVEGIKAFQMEILTYSSDKRFRRKSSRNIQNHKLCLNAALRIIDTPIILSYQIILLYEKQTRTHSSA
jgi:hypothetical protein